MESLTKTKIEVKKEQEIKSKTTPSRLSIILISLFITFIFSFMAVDYITLSNRIESNVATVNEKMDSLNLYVNNKSAVFDKNLKTQEEQLNRVNSLNR
jgi:hypothetical protein